MKKCSKCGELKGVENFTKDRRRLDGLDPWCRACKKESKDKNKENNAAKSKAWRAANSDKRSAAWKDWYEKNKDHRRAYQATDEYKEMHRKSEASRRRDHREKYLAQKKKYRELNPEAHKNSFIEWKNKNPDRMRVLKRAAEIRRRDRKSIACESVNSDFAKDVYRRFNNKCFNCGSTERLSIDHHHPLSGGHALNASNAVLLCVRCNSKKKDKHPSVFYDCSQIELLRSEFGVETLSA